MSQGIKRTNVWNTFNHQDHEAVCRILNNFLYEITTPVMSSYQSMPRQCDMQYMELSEKPLTHEVRP